MWLWCPPRAAPTQAGRQSGQEAGGVTSHASRLGNVNNWARGKRMHMWEGNAQREEYKLHSGYVTSHVGDNYKLNSIQIIALRDLDSILHVTIPRFPIINHVLSWRVLSLPPIAYFKSGSSLIIIIMIMHDLRPNINKMIRVILHLLRKPMHAHAHPFTLTHTHAHTLTHTHAQSCMHTYILYRPILTHITPHHKRNAASKNER